MCTCVQLHVRKSARHKVHGMCIIRSSGTQIHRVFPHTKSIIVGQRIVFCIPECSLDLHLRHVCMHTCHIAHMEKYVWPAS